jgi:mono/diheme cytochrome c family protein
MSKRVFFALIAATLAVSFGFAGQSNATVNIPVNSTKPTDGKQMFTSYCAPCHGVNGRGNGPVASQLKTSPSDLTLLTKNNQGKYPSAHILSVLQFGSDTPSHGTQQMPVWGPILGGTSSVDKPAVEMLRETNLSRYLESIQVK